MNHLLSPSLTLKSSDIVPLLRPHTTRTPIRIIKCINSRSDSSNFSGVVGSNRADWQTSCAILASNSMKNGTEKSGTGNAINGHQTLDLVSIDQNRPKPLTITDLSPAPMHGSTLRVAYQGVPGAYSEAAAGKAYPNCEAIPCDQFEVAFQAVELWIADRAVLPVENSLGGSIHRNYDLLLRSGPEVFIGIMTPIFWAPICWHGSGPNPNLFRPV